MFANGMTNQLISIWSRGFSVTMVSIIWLGYERLPLSAFKNQGITIVHRNTRQI